MTKVFLIDETILKSETPLGDNVASENIRPAIETAQDIYLQQLIGTELLDRLYNDIAENKLEGLYKELVDEHITNYLKYKVLSEITIPLAFKYRNAGVVQATGDHYQQSSLRDAQLVQQHYELRANFYAERMSKYLCANSDNFPEYRSTRDSADMMADPDAYQTNWVL